LLSKDCWVSAGTVCGAGTCRTCPRKGPHATSPRRFVCRCEPVFVGGFGKERSVIERLYDPAHNRGALGFFFKFLQALLPALSNPRAGCPDGAEKRRAGPAASAVGTPASTDVSLCPAFFFYFPFLCAVDARESSRFSDRGRPRAVGGMGTRAASAGPAA